METQLIRKSNGTYIFEMRHPQSGVVASKKFYSYMQWRNWALDVLGRVPHV